MKLTTKQEKFVQEWYATGNKTEAYRTAYDAENMSDAVINVKASELSRNGKIAVRYRELSGEGQKRSEVTVDTINAMLMTAFKIAKKDDNAGAIVQTANSLSKLHGLDRLTDTQIKKIEKEIESSNNMDTEVQPLNITFEVSAPVSDIKVTQGE